MSQTKNPLPDKHYIKEDNEASHLAGSMMAVPDIFSAFSKLPLRERIEQFKQQLSETYLFLLNGAPETKELSDEACQERFLDEYQISLDRLKDNISATKCKNIICHSLPTTHSTEVSNLFPVAFMWIVCADLLEQHGFHENAWSSLIEFKNIEHQLGQALATEEKLQKKAYSQKAGGQAYKDYSNLKYSFIDLLRNSPPIGGWKTLESAAHELAEKVLAEHENSEHRARYSIKKERVETKLNTWLRDVNGECRAAYDENAAKHR
ncbi:MULTISPECIES: hypothetical protein [Halomonadaceae]|jgi:hypothetical protein|uniref:Uncharacterized protein n=2 Tax=root TaxID=1 RepID=L9U7W4_9GAMM|nr:MULTISPECIES: hypothetical protein [Halomonas]QGQ69926.1 hypothetical protein FDY98_07300 [Halomonas sp. PA16-9]ELY20716.1 hypothetical protein HALTITAN_2558 [Halomonas titanicae BH1]NVE92442.1 hypothetical protein [Halomonas titanicae]PKH63350.1 hypothetical protein CXF94_00740 [Halomonas sp. Choline-3u-9]CAD5268829.1 conserved hypothetical protein [Halomonas sp. 156]|tara:strand:+ start:694 stop:1485 length:792 start_codon:yes stop_codon:yes gene_type:complete